MAVQCLDSGMRGRSLASWMDQQAATRAEAAKDQAAYAEARREAQDSWRGEADLIARSSGVDLSGRSIEQIDRLAREMSCGKGIREKPFVGRAEYVDPIRGGFEIGVAAVETEAEVVSAAEADDVKAVETSGDDGAGAGLARFRRKDRARSANRNPGEKH